MAILIAWFQEKYIELTEAQSAQFSPRAHTRFALDMAEVFASISDNFCFSTEQLLLLLDVIEDPDWRTNVYLSGIARVHDIQNFDFIKHKAKFPEVM